MILDIRCAYCPVCAKNREVTIVPEKVLMGSDDRINFWVDAFRFQCPDGHTFQRFGGFERTGGRVVTHG